jgi:hypothetical protein
MITLYTGVQLLFIGVLCQMTLYIARRVIEEYLWPKMPRTKVTKDIQKPRKHRMANPISDAELSDNDDLPLNSSKTPILTKTNGGSAQFSLAGRNLQLEAVQQSVAALAPLAKEKLTNNNEIDDSSKKAFLSLIDTFAHATSSLNSPTSNNILDGLAYEEKQEQEIQYLMKTLSILNNSK